MKKVMCLVVAMISVFVYGFAFAGSTNPTVTVVNTSSNPVPVTGNLGISGTANVNVINAALPVTGSVNVTNTQANPVHVKDAAIKIPFQTGFECSIDGGNGCTANSDKEIPEGMRLVVEYVSARILVTKDNTVEVHFRVGDATAGNGVRDFHVSANRAGETVTGTISIYSVSEKLLVFADRTETHPNVIMFLYSPYPEEHPSGYIQDGLLTGYLVPAP
jgi:hypothetical protein